jgi:hypothetical protein
MKNPKQFAPTPWTWHGRNDKSGPDKNLSAHGRPTNVKATGMQMQGPTPRSGEGYKALGHTGTQMGEMYAVSSDRSEMPTNKMGMHPAIDKSEPKPAKDPQKWHKQSRYSLTVPATDAEGAKIAAKMKAH